MTHLIESDDIEHLSLSIDLALERGDVDALRSLVKSAAQLYTAQTEALPRAYVAYCRANIHAGLRKAAAVGSQAIAWAWDALDSKQEIYWLRVASADLAAAEHDPRYSDVRCRVETNLGNALSGIGRFCEALEHWDAVISLKPGFGMAHANRGYGLTWYGRSLYDPGHSAVFFWHARGSLASGLAAGVEDHAVESIVECLNQVEALGDWGNFRFEPDRDSLGDSDDERGYRQWCLRERLFLNPLNDLGPYPIAARDVVTFPSIRHPFDSGPLIPEVYGIYNQLIQEYVSARYLCFEATKASTVREHFSDKDVLLYDTLDYRVLRLWVEKLKMTYLSVFAAFDKIAFLVNHYWKLQIPYDKVNFGSLWFNKRDAQHGVRSEFDGAMNWPLRGLFNLSRDLYWRSDGELVAEPQAKLLQTDSSDVRRKKRESVLIEAKEVIEKLRTLN